jgi:hypothetical protein
MTDVKGNLVILNPKRRYTFAFTNAEVDSLNNYARSLHKQRVVLGDDQMLKTATGVKEFAAGERIQFTEQELRDFILDAQRRRSATPASAGALLPRPERPPPARPIGQNLSGVLIPFRPSPKS